MSHKYRFFSSCIVGFALHQEQKLRAILTRITYLFLFFLVSHAKPLDLEFVHVKDNYTSKIPRLLRTVSSLRQGQRRKSHPRPR